ncbi:MAG: fused MFS/spermidine synthase [Candidatus Aminicenantes bacterium]|nr:fused MFS/spermidine synthase [Candidatus Aminicenantes bacterium]
MANRESRRGAGGIAPLYFFLGAFSLVFQTILLREFFTVAAGNEISFGIALGSWLLGVCGGSFAAGWASTRIRPGANALPWAIMLQCLVAPLLLVAARCLQSLGAAPRGMVIPLGTTFWLIPLLTVPFSFCSGFIFPLAATLEPASAATGSRKLVRAYAWESFGAMSGGVLYTFWLLEKFNPTLIIFLFTLPLLLVSLIFFGARKMKKTRTALFLLLALNLYAILAGWAGRLDSWLVHQRWLGLSGTTWVESRDSKYQNLQLGLAHGQYSLFGNGQLTAAFPDDDPQEIQAAQIITQHPHPRRVLIIGEGASGLAKHLLDFRIDSLAAVEMDGELLDMIVRHLPAESRRSLDDPRLRMPVLDGRRFVKEAARAADSPENRYDLVYLHQPDAWTAQLNRYYTREFFLDLKAILAEGGVMAMSLSSAENYASEISNPYTATVYRTLKSVFPEIAVAPGATNFFSASAAPASVSTDPRVLAARYDRLAAPPARLGAIFSSLYPKEKTAFILDALERYPVRFQNRDLRPIAYFLCGRLLGWTSGSPLSGFFDFFEKLPFARLLIFLIVLLVLAVSWVVWRGQRARGRGKLSLLLAAASGGFAGLSFEIMTVFAFQNIWGYVYRTIGLLIAAFMLGMGVGAALTDHTLERKQPPAKTTRRLLAGSQLLIAAACLAFLPLLGFAAKMPGSSGQIPLFAWLGGIGFLAGSILPLGLRCLGDESAAKKAGQLNAADYLGGCFGAMAMAAIFLPIYGSANGLLLVAVPALAAAMLLLAESRLNDPGPA